MDAITLDAQPRDTGKRATKAIRRAEEVPCVLYGQHTDPVHFRVPILGLRSLIYTAETHVVSVTVDGESHDAIVKNIDFHPVTDVPIHMDFLALTAGETLDMTVPVVTVGIAAGVKAGGILSQPLNELEIRCLPRDIPGQVEVDVTDLEIGDSVHVAVLEVENVEVLTDEARTVVSITAPRAEEEPEEEDGLLLEGEDGAEAADGEQAEAAADAGAEGESEDN
ncbi:MAG: 50S ribosomal protein L25 [Bacteroidota bacterium]